MASKKEIEFLANRGVGEEAWNNQPVGEVSWQGGGSPAAATLDPSIFIVEGGNDLGYFSGFTGIKFTSSTPTLTTADADAVLSSLPTLTDGLGYGRNLNTGAREYILHTQAYSPNTVDIPEGMIVYAPETVDIEIDSETTITVRIPVLMG